MYLTSKRIAIDMTDAKILIIDDDRELGEMLREFLAPDHFDVSACLTGEDGLQALQDEDYELVILDIMLPGASGIDVLRQLRQSSDIPVIMLTARGDDVDRILGLEFGADDYLSKPFEPRELVLRINNIMRRVGPAQVPSEPIRLGAHVFDPEREELSKDGRPVRLTGAEASLLSVLSRSPGEVLSREVLIERCRISGSTRTVDVLVTRMRRKIETDPRVPRYLQTVRGQGYILRPDEG